MESILGSTFYKKELPVHLDSFTGVAGRKLFREMIQAGTGECFFSLFTSFSTQNDPAFCGVSSLSMVLNALEIDPRRQWKGVWRWYTDEQLDCCASISEMRLKGITFNQFSCLARCHASVVSKPADRHSLEEFRRDIQLITSSEGTHMVISFSRPALGQTGSGHFSPIGGYHAGEDKVLVLDSARFKYPPFFVTVQELWGSLLPVDPETGKCRGYFLISANEQQKSDIQRRRVGVAKGENGIGTSPSNGTTTASLSSASSSQLDQSQAPSSWIPSPGHYSNVEASWMRSPGHHPNVEASSLQPTQSQASSSPKPSPGQDPSINTHPKDDISADCNCDCDC
ncbi:Phytochelatin synthase-domain-containing protein [Mortierella sp. GBAus27b]|nr:Phytochelatin synthase-domain-containing protein [Mortierella sp. GBAus27b]